MNLYTILISHCIQIRQKDLLAQFVRINAQLAKLTTGDSSSSSKVSSLLRKHYHLNVRLIQLARFIQHHTRSCAYLLSCTLPGLLTIQCYLIPVLLFNRNIPLFYSLYYIDVMLQLNAMIFGIIHYCSLVGKNNSALERQNYVFYVNYLIKQQQQIATGHFLSSRSVDWSCKTIVLCPQFDLLCTCVFLTTQNSTTNRSS